MTEYFLNLTTATGKKQSPLDRFLLKAGAATARVKELRAEENMLRLRLIELNYVYGLAREQEQ